MLAAYGRELYDAGQRLSIDRTAVSEYIRARVKYGNSLLRNFVDICISYCRRSGQGSELVAVIAVYLKRSRVAGGAVMSWTRERCRT